MYRIPQTIEEADALTLEEIIEMMHETDPEKVAAIKASREMLEPEIMARYIDERDFYCDQDY